MRVLYFFTAAIFLFAGANAFSQTSISTDQSDYPPGSTVYISGSGFQPGEPVQLQVINLTNPSDDGSEHQPWQVTADANGNFQTTWYVTSDEANTTLQLTATGLDSGLTAQEIFTDSSYQITSISIGHQNGSLTYGATGSATYTVTNFFSGNGQAVQAVTNLVTTGLPSGATASIAFVPTTGPGDGGDTGAAGAFTNKLTISISAATPAGTYTITVTGNDNKGGHATNTAALTIGKATQTITFNPLNNHNFGDSFTLSATASSGLPVSFTVASGPATIVGTTLTVTGTGTVKVDASQSGNANYNSAPVVERSFTASATTLTVTANNTNRIYGAPNPAFTASYSGFIGSDNSSVLSGSPAFSTVANTTSNVGVYTIVITNGTLIAANYAFAFVNGQQTNTQASTTNVVSVSANPSPTGSNVTLTAALSALAPGSGTPTGTVQFFVDAAPFGSATTLNSGTANLNTASLAHGYHTISAQYTGDGNFFGSTNNLSSNLLIDTAPTTGTFTLAATENTAVNFSAVKLASAAKDADHDALSVTAANASSAQGGTVSLSSGTITYTPPNSFTGADSFTYTVADTFGVTATGTVNVTVSTSNGQTLNIVSLTVLPDSTVQLGIAGIPGRNYLIQATTNIVSPNWATIATNAAGPNGLLNFIDTAASNLPTRFYRTAAQ